MELSPGLVAEKEIIVEDRFVAAHLGSGGVPSYSTPSMVLHMEETSRMAVDHLLGPDGATVGGYIAVKHLAPTPKGMRVRIRSSSLRSKAAPLPSRLKHGTKLKKSARATTFVPSSALRNLANGLQRKKQQYSATSVARHAHIFSRTDRTSAQQSQDRDTDRTCSAGHFPQRKSLS